MPKPMDLPKGGNDAPVTPESKRLVRVRDVIEETAEAKKLSEAAADIVETHIPEPATKRRGGRTKGDETKDFNTPLTAEERDLLQIVRDHQKPLSNRYVARNILVKGLKEYAKLHELHDPTE